MRIFLLGICLAIGLWGPAQAQDADIEATITAQIDAFRADDFETAFGFASPGIRGLFGSSDNFGAMVRGGYPMVWRPAEIRYLDLRNESGTLWQRVEIVDGAGRVHLLDYQMIKVGNDWKINGVNLLESNELSA